MAPKAPPEEMPRRCGSASGLRVTDCRLAPTSASPAPTITASSARGKRNSHTIASRPADHVTSTDPGEILLASTPQTVDHSTAMAPTETATVRDRSRAMQLPSRNIARPAHDGVRRAVTPRS